MEHHPNIVSKSELEFHLWGDMPPGSDALKSHIYLLRKKIDKDFSEKLIHTLHGFGYRIGSADA
jgi:DNA-binding response OmpR family regulator